MIRGRWLEIAGLAFSGVATLAVLTAPRLTILLVGLVVGGYWVLKDARVRLLALVFGGLLVLQSDLEDVKTAYVVLGALSVAIAWVRVGQMPSEERELFGPLLWASAGLGVYLAGTLLVSDAHGISPALWARDVLPYLMLAGAPVLGIDFGRSLSRRFLTVTIVAAGVLAAVSFAVLYLARRGVSSLPIERLGISGLPLCAFVFCLAVAHWGTGARRRHWWGLFAVTVLALLLVSGTRNAALFVLAFVAVLGTRRRGRVPLTRAIAMGAGLVALSALVVPLLAGQLSSDPEFIQRRLASLTDVSALRSSDASVLDRQRQYALADEAWDAYPVFGTGPGHLYEAYRYAVGEDRYAFTLDTPLVTPAKLGWVGLGVLAWFFAALLAVSRRLRRAAGPGVAFTTGRAYLAVTVVGIPLGSVVENKTFAMTMFLLLAGQVAHRRLRRLVDVVPGVVVLEVEPPVGLVDRRGPVQR